MTREDVSRVIPYTPLSLVHGLIDNNIAEGIVVEDGGAITLTPNGRDAAEAVVRLQEDAVAALWSSAGSLGTVERFARSIVERATTIDPPMLPSNFALFAPVCDRPEQPGRVLRLITAIRYWRADAHRRAVSEESLQPFEAHALGRLWYRSKDQADRVGQGYPEPGRKGVASLEERGLAADGVITADGTKLRDRIEEQTDDYTAPLYELLDDSAREQLLAATTALPS